MVDMTLLNSWSLYKRDTKFLEIPPKNILHFTEFKLLVETDLLKANKDCCLKKEVLHNQLLNLKSHAAIALCPRKAVDLKR